MTTVCPRSWSTRAISPWTSQAVPSGFTETRTRNESPPGICAFRLSPILSARSWYAWMLETGANSCATHGQPDRNRMAASNRRRLCINAADLERPGHLVDCKDIRTDAHGDFVLFSGLVDRIERRSHHPFEAPVDTLQAPEVSHPVLHPFKIRDGHSAGVRQDVRYHEDSLFLENGVGACHRRAVRPFSDYTRLQFPCHGRRDLVFPCCRNQDVT